MGDMASRPFFSLIDVSGVVLLSLCYYRFMVFKFHIFIRVEFLGRSNCFDKNVLNLNILF